MLLCRLQGQKGLASDALVVSVKITENENIKLSKIKHKNLILQLVDVRIYWKELMNPLIYWTHKLG